jgi:hypothetical protein
MLTAARACTANMRGGPAERGRFQRIVTGAGAGKPVGYHLTPTEAISR